MKTIAATIGSKNYYLVIGFDVCSFVAEAVNAPGFYKEDGMPSNPGKLARETLALASSEHHPDMNWREFIEEMPSEHWAEVWAAFDAVMDTVEEIAGSHTQHTQTSEIDIASDAFIMAQGGHAA